ncbi:MAG TPA: hypothetical protein VJZ71_10570 [Phycisphaerae bacterium]|nr:hypothetical protein [Phycisphaerae bacterium]
MSSPLRLNLLVSFPFFSLIVVFGLLSNGVYHDDDLTHYLMARWAGWYPSYLLHIWGRPGLTLPLAAVAWIGDREIGWHAARLLSAIVTTASALLAAHVARRFEIRPAWLVVVFLFLQPLATLLGFTTLTENFAALYLIAAVALLQGGRPLFASAVFSLVLVTRHETAAFLPVWCMALFRSGAGVPARRDRITALVLSLWAPVAHNIAYYAVFDSWPLRIFFQARGSTQYTPQALWSYLPDALYAVPPAIAGLAIVGTAVMLRRRAWLVPAIAATFFLTQVAIKALGVYGSGGYGRFLVVIAPFIAILAVAGVAELIARLRERRPIDLLTLILAIVWLVGLIAFELERIERRQEWREDTLWLMRGTVVAILFLLLAWAVFGRRGGNRYASPIIAGLLMATCLIQCAAILRPLRLRPSQELARQAVHWLGERGLADSPIFATDPWFAYFLDLVENPRAHKGAMLLASMPVGTVFIWDSIYSPSDFHRLPAEEFDRDSHYELLRILSLTEKSRYELRLYRKTSPTPLPTTREVYYPPVPEDPEPVRGSYYIRPYPHKKPGAPSPR